MADAGSVPIHYLSSLNDNLPSLISYAAQKLASAKNAAEVLDARGHADAAYNAAKIAARLNKAKNAHGDVVAACRRAQGDALFITAQADIRLANEYDAAQERGEVKKAGRNWDNEPVIIPEWNNKPATAAEAGIDTKQIFHARQIRDAESANPGTIRAAIDAQLDDDDEPTRASLKRAVDLVLRPEANEAAPVSPSVIVRRAILTGDNEWFTPQYYVELVRSVLGVIDLDPASHEEAQKVVRAEAFFTKADNGLTRPWHGKVFLNPPYARDLMGLFVAKLCEELTSGRVTEAIMLTNNDTDTSWFQKAGKKADMICFKERRLKFYKPDGTPSSPTQGQAFFYFGPNRTKFKAIFSEIGICRQE